MVLDRPAALWRECAEIVRFCRELTDEEWLAPSRAPGWRVQDVVAHLGASCHALFTPASLKLIGSKRIERTNDEFVDARREWAPARVLAEFELWSRRLRPLSLALDRTPLGRLPVPLGELGRFPARLLLNSALVFDQHTHLRHDLAPALGRPAPRTDELRIAVVLEWMIAVLGNQLRQARPSWLNRPIALSLGGPGGGRWRIGVDGTVTTAPADSGDSAVHIAGAAAEFPEWGTARSSWRDRDVKIDGDVDLGVALLDSLNVV